jgi:glycosyltransferase involved in cell wall biosynthesis
MRCVLLDSVPLAFGGGYETLLLKLARALLERGHAVDVLTPSRRAAAVVHRLAGVQVFDRLSASEVTCRLAPGREIVAGPRSSRSAVRHADIVYSKNEPQDVAFARAIVPSAIPLVVGFHSAMWGRAGIGGALRARAYKSRAYGWLLRSARCFHCLQPAQRDFLVGRHQVSISDTYVIPNGVDLTAFRPEGPPERDVFRVLFMGRLDMHKGVDVLLDAIAGLGVQGDLEFAIGGDGPMRSRVESVARARRDVRFLGHVPSPEVVYRDHDLLVSPARWDVYPLVPAEAFSSGLPAILSDIDAHEMYRESGAVTFHDPEDSEGLRLAVESHLESWRADRRAHESLRRRARSFAEDMFDERASLGSLVELLESRC